MTEWDDLMIIAKIDEMGLLNDSIVDAFNARALPEYLDILDEDDYFGEEGWKQTIGIER